MRAGKLRMTYLNQRLRRGSRRSSSAPAATPSDLLDHYLGCCTRQLPRDKYLWSLPGWAHPIASRKAARAGYRRRQYTVVIAATINAPAIQPLQNVCARRASGIGKPPCCPGSFDGEDLPSHCSFACFSWCACPCGQTNCEQACLSRWPRKLLMLLPATPFVESQTYFQRGSRATPRYDTTGVL